MAHIHDHGHAPTTVVEEESSTSILAIVLIVAIVALLAWFLFFSGVVFDRDVAPTDSDRTEIRNEEEGDTNIINPDTDTDNTDTDSGTTGYQSPAPSNP